MAVAWSSSNGVALRYVLPVLWMTSRLAVVGRMSVHGLSVAKYSIPHSDARLGRSLISMIALFLCCRESFFSLKHKVGTTCIFAFFHVLYFLCCSVTVLDGCEDGH